MKKLLRFLVFFAALSTYVSGASTPPHQPLESEIALIVSTTQRDRLQEKERVEVKLTYKDGVLKGVNVLVSSFEMLESKTHQYNTLPSTKSLADLIFKQLIKTKKLKHPIDLIGIYNLITEIIQNFEDGPRKSEKAGKQKIKKQ